MTRPPRHLAGRLLAGSWSILALLVLWEGGVRLSGLSPVVMPGPVAIARDIASAPALYAVSTAQTLLLSASGLALGMALGTLLALAAWLSRVLSGLLTPLSLVLASVPVVALVPVLARIFGYDVRTVLVIVTILSFFPAFVFTASGLRALPAGSDDLVTVLGASRLARLRLLAIPAAVPNWAVSLRIAAANSVLAATVAEFLMGTGGLGHLFDAARSTLDMERALGASAAATAISVTAFLFASRLEKWAHRRWR